MGAVNRTTVRISLREARGDRGPMPASFVDEVMAHFDPGTQRAILRLYRSSPEEKLAAAGADLGARDVPGARRLG